MQDFKGNMFFDEVAKYIDPVKDNPTEVKRLFRLLDNVEYYNYFFKSRIHVDWCPILLENGLLRYKQEFSLYYLPFEFLINCAEQNYNHDLILKVLFHLKDDFSNEESILPINYHRIVKICSLLKPKFAVQTVELVKWCLRKSESKDMLLDQIGPFIKTLNSGGYRNEIFQIFSIVFVSEVKTNGYFKLKEFSFEYESYWLTEIFNKIEEIILEGDTARYFEHLVDQYNSALQQIYPRKRDELDWDDRSYISRPAIKNSEQNSGYSDQDSLIVMIRNMIDLVKSDEKRSELMNIILKKEYPVFRRFALYMITEYPNLIPQFQTDLINPENIFNTSLQHEIHRLIELRYKELDTAKIDTIIEEADIQVHKDIPANEIENIIYDMQVGLLMSIQKNSPTEQRQKQIQALEAKLGYTPQHPEYPFYTYSSTGFDSPITSDELGAKSWEDIKKYLLAFDKKKAIRTIENRPEYEGLARVFGAVIRKRLDEFLECIDIFKDPELRPSYIGIIPEILVIQGNTYDRKRILACADYLDWTWSMIDDGELQISPPQSRYSLIIGFKRLFSHLYSVFNNDDNEIGEADIEKFRSLLIRYNPEISVEELGLDEPYQDFINRTKGEYLQAWFALNLRLKRKQKIDGFLDEFKAILDNGLQRDAYVHVLLGRFLSNIAFLDRKWVINKIDQIFPFKTNRELWEYTIKGFLWSTSWTDDLFKSLLPNLKKACSLGLKDRQIQSLAERIGVFYIRKNTHSLCYNQLIKPLIREGIFNSELSNSLIYFLGNQYVEPKNGHYIRKYVNYRFKVLKETDIFDRQKEIIRFLSIYKCYPQLNNHNFRIFNEAMKVWSDEEGNPRVLMNFYNTLCNREEFDYLNQLLRIEFKKPKRWGMLYEKEYRELFIKLYEQNNPKYRKTVNRIINYLGEQGFYQFRDLYEEYGGDDNEMYN